MRQVFEFVIQENPRTTRLFQVGSEEGLFYCEIPKDVSLMQKKNAGILCGMFLFSILPSLYKK